MKKKLVVNGKPNQIIIGFKHLQLRLRLGSATKAKEREKKI